MSDRTRGRMLNKDISDSKKFAKLSPEAAVLFTMLIPHMNSYGKLNGGIGFLKDEVCPLISYITYKNIEKLLQEITENTNVKWFRVDGRYWIHSINFLSEHQNLNMSRLGQDLLPSYSKLNQDERTPEVEVEVEVEVEGKNGCYSGVIAENAFKRKTKTEEPKQTFGEFVTLTKKQHEKLKEKFGEKGREDRIEKLNIYIGKKGKENFYKKYSSCYHCILDWYKETTGESLADRYKPL